MHICNEHLHAGETKKCMKCFFGKANTAPSTQAIVQQPITPAPLLTNKTETDDAMVINVALQQSQDGITDEFNKLTSSFGRQASSNDNNGDGQMPSKISIKIADLFDFMNMGWISLHECSVSWSLNEELELYELLDMDAPGYHNVNMEIDPVLESVLHHVQPKFFNSTQLVDYQSYYFGDGGGHGNSHSQL